VKNKLAPRRAMIRTSPDQILRPVVALDIDGTLGYYHEHFRRYAEAFLWRSISMDWDGTQPYWRLFGVSKARYREMKLGYRQGRMKRSMPVVEGSAELARKVRAAGAEIWVCTTRPYLRLDNIDPDTQFWLRQNRIQFDGMLFGENKYRDLVSMVGRNRVIGVLDDDPDQIVKANKAGIYGFLIDRDYNRRWDGKVQEINRGARIQDLEHAMKEFVDMCHIWKETNGV